MFAQAFQLTELLVTDTDTKDILHYIFLLHPGYGYDNCFISSVNELPIPQSQPASYRLQIGLANVYISSVFEGPCTSGKIPK